MWLPKKILTLRNLVAVGEHSFQDLSERNPHLLSKFNYPKLYSENPSDTFVDNSTSPQSEKIHYHNGIPYRNRNPANVVETFSISECFRSHLLGISESITQNPNIKGDQYS